MPGKSHESMAHFRFYAELNDFLPPFRRGTTFPYVFEGRGSIKDLIEALGVPHPEIDLILVNGESVDFSYTVQDGDRVSVYPVFESIDITPLVRVRPAPLRDTRFVLDGHLGRLAAYLRLLGFDTLYHRDYSDEELVTLSQDERRILLTRDRGLLKRRAITHGYWVREINPRRQLVEVLQRFDLSTSISPFRRCLCCNGLLQPVSKGAISAQLPPRTRAEQEEFHLCPGCGRIYWKGSHYWRMARLIVWVKEQLAAPTSSP